MPPARPMSGPVFMHSDTCPRCESALRRIIPFFEQRNIALTIRKPTVQETKTPGFGYPALFLPIGSLGLDQPYLLVGADLLTGLEALVD